MNFLRYLLGFRHQFVHGDNGRQALHQLLRVCFLFELASQHHQSFHDLFRLAHLPAESSTVNRFLSLVHFQVVLIDVEQLGGKLHGFFVVAYLVVAGHNGIDRCFIANVLIRDLRNTQVEHLLGFILLAFRDQCIGQCCHLHPHVRKHARAVLVEVHTFFIGTAPQEFVHHVVIHHIRVYPSSLGHFSLRILDWHQAVSQTVELEVVLKSQVSLCTGRYREIDRALPVVMCNEVEYHQIVLGQVRAVDRPFDIFHETCRIFHRDHLLTHHGHRIYRHVERFARQVIQRLAIAFKLIGNIVGLHELDGFSQVHRAGTLIHDVYHITCTLYVFLGWDRERHRSRLISRTAHLVDVPVGLQ